MTRESDAVKLLVQWIKRNSILLVNAGSLIGTNMMTSFLGFVYWLVAARQFTPESVGIASASISAMTLISSFCIMGLGSLLITELPRQPGHEGTLISTSLIVVGGVGLSVGIVFAFIASHVSSGFRPIGANFLTIMNFAAGVSLTAITVVLDQALVGLLLGKLQLWRNTIFAVTKLVVLYIISLVLLGEVGISIYTTWAIGNAFSLGTLAVLLVLKKGWPERKDLPQWGLLRKLGPAAIQHHLLNTTLQLPTSALPVVVTIVLSAKMNAWFYVSWTIVGFVFFVPVALTMVLHAMNSAQQSTLAHKARATITIALLVSALAICLLQIVATKVLGIFGSSYAAQASWALRILVLAAFPLVVKNHYISLSRIHNRIKGAMLLIAPGSLIELCAAALGGQFGGLTGVSIGWVTAIYIESLFMLPTVYKAVLRVGKPTLSVNLQYTETQTVGLVDTFILPAIILDSTRTPFPIPPDLSHIDTTKLPVINPSYVTEGVRGIDTSVSSEARVPATRQTIRKLRLENYR